MLAHWRHLLPQGRQYRRRALSRETLADGPSLDDFVSDNVPERIVLGNKNTYAETFFPLTGHGLTARTR
jgi:hypothetical protein